MHGTVVLGGAEGQQLVSLSTGLRVCRLRGNKRMLRGLFGGVGAIFVEFPGGESGLMFLNQMHPVRSFTP